VRPRLVVVLWAMSLLLVAGCGTRPRTGPGTGPQPDTAAAPVPGPTVVGLGDSVMAGTSCGCEGIMVRYAEREEASTGRAPIVPVNLGADGATTTTLVADLRTASVVGQVRRARVVAVIIGANDLVPQLRRQEEVGCPRSCYAPAVAAMGRRFGTVLAAVQAARASRPGAVLVLDYWNVFPDGDQTRVTQGRSLVAWARAVSRLANAEISARSAAYGDRFVDLYQPMLADGDPTDLLAADGDHPNSRGVDLIVDRLVAATPHGVFDP
jgi:lysophospholipase L1-like esterase